MGVVDQGTELHNWMTLLTRFTSNKPLPKSLINQIDNHFSYYWANDRLASISPDDEYMNALPRSIKRTIMTNYLFEDIFYRFRQFFQTGENKDSKFLYDISFGFMPRRFVHDLPGTETDESIIYDPDDEVPEMYFIMEGMVGVGYYMPFGRDNPTKCIKLAKYLKEWTFICDYYVIENKKSEFLYKAVREVKAYALQKKHLREVFKKYPDIH